MFDLIKIDRIIQSYSKIDRILHLYSKIDRKNQSNFPIDLNTDQIFQYCKIVQTEPATITPAVLATSSQPASYSYVMQTSVTRIVT